ncbi:hypothetical protein BE20_05875 [Sorangium cellulosum]|nr:hypothetical protein BE20_05875 [Sorangium cellulosum]
MSQISSRVSSPSPQCTHLLPQPSPPTWLPSSQSSPASTTPLPQVLTLVEATHAGASSSWEMQV